MKNTTKAQGAYKKITPQNAKVIIDEEKTDYIILDVRSEEEFKEGHIENAVLLPNYEIYKNAEKVLIDNDMLILVYCRSGVRSENAARELLSMGYKNIMDLGGIIDWPYETVK